MQCLEHVHRWALSTPCKATSVEKHKRQTIKKAYEYTSQSVSMQCLCTYLAAHELKRNSITLFYQQSACLNTYLGCSHMKHSDSASCCCCKDVETSAVPCSTWLVKLFLHTQTIEVPCLSPICTAQVLLPHLT